MNDVSYPKMTKFSTAHFPIKISTALFSIFLYFSTPNTLYWDSYLYLGSANSLFSTNFLSQYHWLREPGYPFVIHLLNSIGSIEYIFAFQYFLNWLSVLMLFAIYRYFRPSDKIGFLSHSLANLSIAFGSGYAASILQQTFFVFVVIATSYLLVRGETFRFFWSSVIGITLIAAMLSTILWAGLLAMLFMYAIFQVSKRSESSNTYIKVLIASLISGILFSSIWYGFKANQDRNVRIYQDAWHFWEFNQTWNKPTANELANTFYRIAEIPSVMFALSQFGIETTYSTKGLVSGESQVFIASRFNESEYCGKKFPGPEKYIEATNLRIDLTCKIQIW